MNNLEMYSIFRTNIDLIPEPVALDVLLRISDWLASNGNINDEYVAKQLEYANKFIINR